MIDSYFFLYRGKTFRGTAYLLRYSHVCVMCWKRMLLGFDKKANAWKTAKGLTHIRDVH